MGRAIALCTLLLVSLPPSSPQLCLISTLAGTTTSTAPSDGLGTSATFGPGGSFGSGPQDLALTASGAALIADTGAHQIRFLSTSNALSTLAGSGSDGELDATGAAAKFSNPAGVAVSPTSGTAYVADMGGHALRAVTPAGVVTTLAGCGHQALTDGLGTAACFSSPRGLALNDASSLLYVADTANNAVRCVALGSLPVTVTRLAGAGAQGQVDGVGAAAYFYAPRGVAVLAGVVYVADTGNHAVRRVVVATGEVSTVAGGGADPGILFFVALAGVLSCEATLAARPALGAEMVAPLAGPRPEP